MMGMGCVDGNRTTMMRPGVDLSLQDLISDRGDGIRDSPSSTGHPNHRPRVIHWVLWHGGVQSSTLHSSPSCISRNPYPYSHAPWIHRSYALNAPPWNRCVYPYPVIRGTNNKPTGVDVMTA